MITTEKRLPMCKISSFTLLILDVKHPINIMPAGPEPVFSKTTIANSYTTDVGRDFTETRWKNGTKQKGKQLKAQKHSWFEMNNAPTANHWHQKN